MAVISPYGVLINYVNLIRFHILKDTVDKA